MSDVIVKNETIYLVGDVRYTDNASVIYSSHNVKAPVDFLLSFQKLMEEFGVVKLDVSTDAYKYITGNSL